MKLIKLTDAHKEVMEVLPNIRQALFIAQNGPFNADMYNSINGADGALESLLGRTVVYDALEKHEQTAVRREIYNKLRDQEFKTLAAFRDVVDQMYADVSETLNKASEVAYSQETMKVHFTHWVAPKDFISYAVKDLKSDCFPYPAVASVVESLDAATEFLNKVAPLMSRIYDDEQQTQEDAPAEAPSPDENNGQGTGHQVYQPFHTEETEDAITEVINACASNKSLSMSAAKLARSGHSLLDLGYKTKDDAYKAIEAFETSRANFFKAVAEVRDMLPNGTNVLESFGRNSPSFYQAVEAIIGLVNKAEMVRAGMDASIETLTSIDK